jgi:hypothetical protein
MSISSACVQCDAQVTIVIDIDIPLFSSNQSIPGRRVLLWRKRQSGHVTWEGHVDLLLSEVSALLPLLMLQLLLIELRCLFPSG